MFCGLWLWGARFFLPETELFVVNSVLPTPLCPKSSDKLLNIKRFGMQIMSCSVLHPPPPLPYGSLRMHHEHPPVHCSSGLGADLPPASPPPTAGSHQGSASVWASRDFVASSSPVGFCLEPTPNFAPTWCGPRKLYKSQVRQARRKKSWDWEVYREIMSLT